MADDRVKAEMIQNPGVTRTFSKPSWEQQKNLGVWRAVDGQDSQYAAPKNVVAANVVRRPANNEKLIQEMAAHARLNAEVKAQPEPAEEFAPIVEEPVPVMEVVKTEEPKAEEPAQAEAAPAVKPKRKYTKRAKPESV